MRARRFVVSFVTCLVSLFAVLAVSSPCAFAQSASAQAQSLFNEGRKLLQAGKFAEACTAFEGSQQLDPAITTLLNLADCREQNHQLATAWGMFVDAGRMAREKNNDKLARVANNHAKKLEPRLSKLTISVPSDHQVTGLEILRGNDRVNPVSWNHALPIDGGTYTITARAPGRASWSATRTVKVEADVQTVEIPKLAEAEPGAPLVVAARPGGPAGTSPPAGPVASSGDVPSSTKPNTSSAGSPPPTAASPAGGEGGASAGEASAAGGKGIVAPSRPVSAEAPTAGSRSVVDATPLPPAATSPVAEQPEGRRSMMVPIAVTGAGLEDATISIDGRVLCERGPCQKRIPEGDHTITVTRRNFKPFSRKITLLARTETQIRVTLAPTQGRSDALVAFLLAAGFGGGGVYLGLQANQLRDVLRKEIATGSPPPELDDPRFLRGKHYAIGADAAFAIGGIAALTAVYFTFRGKGAPSTGLIDVRSVALSPDLRPGYVGLGMGVSW